MSINTKFSQNILQIESPSHPIIQKVLPEISTKFSTSLDQIILNNKLQLNFKLQKLCESKAWISNDQSMKIFKTKSLFYIYIYDIFLLLYLFIYLFTYIDIGAAAILLSAPHPSNDPYTPTYIEYTDEQKYV